jgi:hypothetical protein
MSTAAVAPPSESPDPRAVWAALAIWAALALLAAATGAVASLPRPAIPLLIWSPVLAAVFAYRRSAAVRAFVAGLDLRVPVLFHVVRVYFGAAFLAEAAAGRLPAAFANVAGPGDIVAGALALPAALLATRGDKTSRALLLGWNLLGLVDILVVFLAAQRMLLVLRDERFFHAFRRLPFSALPGLVVPLVLLTHLLVFARLRAQPSAPSHASASRHAAPPPAAT